MGVFFSETLPGTNDPTTPKIKEVVLEVLDCEVLLPSGPTPNLYFFLGIPLIHFRHDS